MDLNNLVQSQVIHILRPLSGLSWISNIRRTKELRMGGLNIRPKTIWGQSYKDFYTLGQIYKCILKLENGVLMQIFFGHNIKTQNPNLFIQLHFSLRQNGQFRHFILHHPKE